jgi:hypothetical protein
MNRAPFWARSRLTGRAHFFHDDTAACGAGDLVARDGAPLFDQFTGRPTSKACPGCLAIEASVGRQIVEDYTARQPPSVDQVTEPPLMLAPPVVDRFLVAAGLRLALSSFQCLQRDLAWWLEREPLDLRRLERARVDQLAATPPGTPSQIESRIDSLLALAAWLAREELITRTSLMLIHRPRGRKKTNANARAV